MAITTLPSFLRDRRDRVPIERSSRRRTPGLRREEVAMRAGVSVTWYTFLEQGRGGVPADAVLERLAQALELELELELDDSNREMLFLLAHDRPPPRKHSQPPAATITPALQLVLDNLSVPAFVKTPTAQIIAWNRAAIAVLGDYAAVPERERNLLRRVFQLGSEHKVYNVEEVRRTCLAAFRIDIARAGNSNEATALIQELMQSSADFRRLWNQGEISSLCGYRKRLIQPSIGEIVLESSILNIEGHDGLSMFVFSPQTTRASAA